MVHSNGLRLIFVGDHVQDVARTTILDLSARKSTFFDVDQTLVFACGVLDEYL